MNYMKKISPVVLRVGMAVIVMWFGVQQLIDPATWIGFLPDWTSSLPMSATTLIYLNGLFEVISGLMLLAGLYTRIIVLLMALHMLEITYTVGYDAIGVRDLGLTIALFTIFLHGSSPFSLDYFFARGQREAEVNKV